MSEGERLFLVVDPEAGTTRALESALQECGARVTVRDSADQALEVLCSEPTELVIASTQLGDGDGFRLCSLMRGQADFDPTPLVFISDDRSKSRRLEGFQAGAADYLSKPFFFAELQMRISALLAREVRVASDATWSVTEGTLAERSLVEILADVEQQDATGTLSIAREGRQAVVHFHDGQIVGAVSGTLEDKEALLGLVAWPAGEYVLRTVEGEGGRELEPGEVVLVSIRPLEVWNEVIDGLPQLRGVYETRGEQAPEVPGFDLEDVAGIFELFGGGRTLGEVISASAPDLVVTLRIVDELLDGGWVERIDEPGEVPGPGVGEPKPDFARWIDPAGWSAGVVLEGEAEAGPFRIIPEPVEREDASRAAGAESPEPEDRREESTGGSGASRGDPDEATADERERESETAPAGEPPDEQREARASASHEDPPGAGGEQDDLPESLEGEQPREPGLFENEESIGPDPKLEFENEAVSVLKSDSEPEIVVDEEARAAEGREAAGEEPEETGGDRQTSDAGSATESEETPTSLDFESSPVLAEDSEPDQTLESDSGPELVSDSETGDEEHARGLASESSPELASETDSDGERSDRGLAAGSSPRRKADPETVDAGDGETDLEQPEGAQPRLEAASDAEVVGESGEEPGEETLDLAHEERDEVEAEERDAESTQPGMRAEGASREESEADSQAGPQLHERHEPGTIEHVTLRLRKSGTGAVQTFYTERHETPPSERIAPNLPISEVEEFDEERAGNPEAAESTEAAPPVDEIPDEEALGPRAETPVLGVEAATSDPPEDVSLESGEQGEDEAGEGEVVAGAGAAEPEAEGLEESTDVELAAEQAQSEASIEQVSPEASGEVEDEEPVEETVGDETSVEGNGERGAAEVLGDAPDVEGMEWERALQEPEGDLGDNEAEGEAASAPDSDALDGEEQLAADSEPGEAPVAEADRNPPDREVTDATPDEPTVEPTDDEADAGGSREDTALEAAPNDEPKSDEGDQEVDEASLNPDERIPPDEVLPEEIPTEDLPRTPAPDPEDILKSPDEADEEDSNGLLWLAAALVLVVGLGVLAYYSADRGAEESAEKAVASAEEEAPKESEPGPSSGEESAVPSDEPVEPEGSAALDEPGPDQVQIVDETRRSGRQIGEGVSDAATVLASASGGGTDSEPAADDEDGAEATEQEPEEGEEVASAETSGSDDEGETGSSGAEPEDEAADEPEETETASAEASEDSADEGEDDAQADVITGIADAIERQEYAGAEQKLEELPGRFQQDAKVRDLYLDLAAGYQTEVRDLEAAKRVYNEYLELFPDGKYASEVRSILARLDGE